jgi:hypothetical protein
MQLFFGTFIHSVSPQKVAVLPNYVLGVGSSGKIEFLKSRKEFDEENSTFNECEKIFFFFKPFLFRNAYYTTVSKKRKRDFELQI